MSWYIIGTWTGIFLLEPITAEVAGLLLNMMFRTPRDWDRGILVYTGDVAVGIPEREVTPPKPPPTLVLVGTEWTDAFRAQRGFLSKMSLETLWVEEEEEVSGLKEDRPVVMGTRVGGEQMLL